MKCNFHVDESSQVKCDMNLGIDLIKALVLNIKFTENIIKADGVPLKGSTEPMVDLGTYELKGFKYRGYYYRRIVYEYLLRRNK